VKNKTQF